MNYLINLKISIETNTAEEYTLIGDFFPWLGLFILIIAIIIWRKQLDFLKNAIFSVATVTQLKEVKDNETNHILYAPVFTFVDNQGKTQTINSSSATRPPQYQVNQRVEVVYRTESPEKAVIKDFSNIWYSSVVFAIAGLFVMFLGIFYKLVA